MRTYHIIITTVMAFNFGISNASEMTGHRLAKCSGVFAVASSIQVSLKNPVEADDYLKLSRAFVRAAETHSSSSVVADHSNRTYIAVTDALIYDHKGYLNKFSDFIHACGDFGKNNGVHQFLK